MKPWLSLILSLLSGQISFAQTGAKFYTVEQKALTTGFYPLKELARRLTIPYNNEEEKVRSIFIWVAAHIAYDYKEFQTPDPDRYAPYESLVADSITGNRRWSLVLAQAALKDKMAVCAGYAALFKVLCNEAGLQAEIITGDARSYDDVGRPYQSNHAWNKVMINKEWKLIDVTWSSNNNKWVSKASRKYTNQYYCIAPELMILDHFPDSLKWSFLANPPSREQFVNQPYINSEQGKTLLSFTPLKGVLERKAGDSVIFRIKLKCKPKTMAIYELENNFWIDYENAVPQPEATVQRDSRVYGSAKVKKGTTAQEDAVIDEIVGYVNSIPDVPEEHVTKAQGKGTGSGRRLFTVTDNEVVLAYPVNHKGPRRLLLYCNGEPILGYLVNGR